MGRWAHAQDAAVGRGGACKRAAAGQIATPDAMRKDERRSSRASAAVGRWMRQAVAVAGHWVVVCTALDDLLFFFFHSSTTIQVQTKLPAHEWHETVCPASLQATCMLMSHSAQACGYEREIGLSRAFVILVPDVRVVNPGVRRSARLMEFSLGLAWQPETGAHWKRSPSQLCHVISPWFCRTAIDAGS